MQSSKPLPRSLEETMRFPVLARSSSRMQNSSRYASLPGCVERIARFFGVFVCVCSTFVCSGCDQGTARGAAEGQEIAQGWPTGCDQEEREGGHAVEKSAESNEPILFCGELALVPEPRSSSRTGLALYPETSPEILWLVWAACSCLFMICCSSARRCSKTTECEV